MANQELCEKQGFVVRGLPVGEKINFRVKAVNIAGHSPPAVLSQPVTIREIMGESVTIRRGQVGVREHSELTTVHIGESFTLRCLFTLQSIRRSASLAS